MRESDYGLTGWGCAWLSTEGSVNYLARERCHLANGNRNSWGARKRGVASSSLLTGNIIQMSSKCSLTHVHNYSPLLLLICDQNHPSSFFFLIHPLASWLMSFPPDTWTNSFCHWFQGLHSSSTVPSLMPLITHTHTLLSIIV